MKKAAQPAWVEETPRRSLRSLFRWGNPSQFKHPNPRLVELIKARFGATDENLSHPDHTGLQEFDVQIPSALGAGQISQLSQIVGSANVLTDSFERVRSGYGKTMVDLFRLREGIFENIPDAVILPRSREDIQAVVRFCVENRIPIRAKGGGTSVTRGFEAQGGGITLDMTVHMNRVIELNVVNETVSVESGILLPDLENILQSAKNKRGAAHNYTLGHFPQSFESATIGGSVVTRGAGQNSTYFGKIEDMVIAQEFVTPAGRLTTLNVPASAMGPDMDALLVGSEGAFGILISVTLRIRRYEPENQQRFSYMFHDMKSAVNAAREIMQAQEGLPSVFRVSDPEETDIALRLFGVEGTPIEWFLRIRGYKKGSRCLLIGTAGGGKEYARITAENVRKTALQFGAMSTTGYVTKKWEHGRFSDPYMRDDLMDFGIITDTLECCASWDKIQNVYHAVRDVCHAREDTVVMTHMSHFYPQGANLYFIFITKIGRAEFLKYHAGIIDAIAQNGAAISHHHGIGRLLAPWLPDAVGPVSYGALKRIKDYFDPENVMNPGVLGLTNRK